MAQFFEFGKVVFLNVFGHTSQLGVPGLILGQRGPDTGHGGLTGVRKVGQTANCLACGLSMRETVVPLAIKGLETVAESRSRWGGVRNIAKFREGWDFVAARMPEKYTGSKEQQENPSHARKSSVRKQRRFSVRFFAQNIRPGTPKMPYSATPRLQALSKMDENAVPYPKACAPDQGSVGISAEASNLQFWPGPMPPPNPPMRAPAIPVSLRPVIDSKKPQERLANPFFGSGDDHLGALINPYTLYNALTYAPGDRYRWEHVTKEGLDALAEPAFREVYPTAPLVLLPARQGGVDKVPSIHGFTIPMHIVLQPSRHCLQMLRTPVLSGAIALLVDSNGAWGMGVLVGKALRKRDAIVQAVAVLAVGTVPVPDPFKYKIYGHLPYEHDALVPDLAYCWKHCHDHLSMKLFKHFVDMMPIHEKNQLLEHLYTEHRYETFV
jgi:hypothetical protein